MKLGDCRLDTAENNKMKNDTKIIHVNCNATLEISANYLSMGDRT